MFVRNGAQVKRGDMLFRIDPQPYRVALEQAQAQLVGGRAADDVAANPGRRYRRATSRAPQANLAIKQNALGRQQALLKQGFTTTRRL